MITVPGIQYIEFDGTIFIHIHRRFYKHIGCRYDPGYRSYRRVSIGVDNPNRNVIYATFVCNRNGTVEAQDHCRLVVENSIR
jgi:hypothetical protein